MDKQVEQQIIDLYQKGYSYTLISNHTGVPKGTVPGVLKKLGIYSVDRKTVVKNDFSQLDSTIIELYQSGESCQAIAQKLQLDRSTIYYRLVKNNITLRHKKGIKHCIRKCTISLDFFKEKIASNREDFDYFLGLFATDGNVYKNMVRIGGISDENVEFLQHWCDFLDNKVSIHKTLRSNGASYQNIVQFKNQDIVDYLKQFGIVPNKTFTLELPYINWNVLRGVFDGDGSITKDKRCLSYKFSIVTASEKFVQQLNNFYTANQIKSHIYIENKNKTPLYQVVVMNQNDVYKIYKHIYKNPKYFLKRKYEKFCPLVEKFTNSSSVNSVKEEGNLLD